MATKRIEITCGWCQGTFSLTPADARRREATTKAGMLFCSPSCTSRHYGLSRADRRTEAVCGHCGLVFPIGERDLAYRSRRSKCGLVFCSVACGAKSSVKTQSYRDERAAEQRHRESLIYGSGSRKRITSKSDDVACQWCGQVGLYTNGNGVGACEAHRGDLSQYMLPWSMEWADNLSGYIRATDATEPTTMIGDISGLQGVAAAREGVS